MPDELGLTTAASICLFGRVGASGGGPDVATGGVAPT